MLTEIVKGIFAFENTPIGGNIVSPVLAVHPYYRIPDLRSVDKSYRDYLTNLEKLIKTYDGPLITLEETSKRKKTARRYRHLGRKENTLFIETESADPAPNEDKTNWEECLEFLKHFNGPFLLVGGRLWEKHGGRLWGKYKGCLGATIEKLEKAKIDYAILKDITFS